MKDFNTANSQDELIPAGTIARATFKLKGGGNYGEHNLLSKSDNTGSIGLNAYFTIDDGKYKGRRIYQLIGIEGVKRKLEIFKKNYFYNLLFKSASIFIFSIFTLFIILNFIEYYSYLCIEVKTVIVFSFISLFITTLYLQIIKPINKYLNFNAFYTNEQAAKIIGDFFPDIKD